jgi:hypothetical protein
MALSGDRLSIVSLFERHVEQIREEGHLGGALSDHSQALKQGA